MSDIRQPLIDEFVKEVTQILDDNKERIVKHAKKNPETLEDLPVSVQNKITALYATLMEDMGDNLVEKANKELDQDNNSAGWDDALFDSAVLVGTYYLLQTMRDVFHRVHSAQIARQITNDAILELPEDATKKEIADAVEEAHNLAVDNAVETGGNILDIITVAEVGFSYYLLAKAETFARGLEHYRWMTQQDERVRPSHAAKHNTIRKWGEGEDVGQAHNCRCYSEFVTADEVEKAGL